MDTEKQDKKAKPQLRFIDQRFWLMDREFHYRTFYELVPGTVEGIGDSSGYRFVLTFSYANGKKYVWYSMSEHEYDSGNIAWEAWVLLKLLRQAEQFINDPYPTA